MKHVSLLVLCFCMYIIAAAQETFPVNGVSDLRSDQFVFTNATIVKDAQTTLQNATLLIKRGKIVAVGANIAIPKDAVVIDCKGKYIYPSFIDIFSDYGIAAPKSSGGGDFFNYINSSPTKGAYGWNQSLKPETDASKIFAADNGKAGDLRSAGFGVVLTHQQDGIARGTGTLVTLTDERENFAMLKDKAAAFYSFNTGTSTQDYPNSLMGCIALLRQTYLDAQWYKTRPATEGTNLSLQAWDDNQNLPQIFDASDKWNDLRAVKIANEFGVQYIIKGGGNEYQRMDEMKASKASFILPVNFPLAIDIEDPNDARVVALSVMKHWEMAPLEPGMFEKANINFALTASGLKSTGDFLSNLRKAIDNGLSATKALEALTKTPAIMIGAYDKVGSLDAGKLANFIITSGPVFDEKTTFFQNWVQGKKYTLTESGWNDYRGNYKLTVKQNNQSTTYNVEVKGKPDDLSATLQTPGDSVKNDVKLSVNDKMVKMTWSLKADSSNLNRLTGLISNEKLWMGNGYSSAGNAISWNMQYVSTFIEKPDTPKKEEKKKDSVTAKVMYPFLGFGWTEAPKQEDMLIKNATVWTSEKEGILENTDVLLKGGKIAAIGKNLTAGNAKVIDGTGKHLTAGIIDEHSHIAVTGSVNECSQSVTAEVRVADVINPDDIQIYRQLAGGVTSAHILHGSCNTIGGQTQLIKMRWGKDAEEMKFANWDGFIKFALGENVKRSFGQSNNRFPDTRMGVEQVLMDAFTRARDYEKLGPNKRKDLELEALSEILEKKRFITCHSYVQSEINMLMHVADTFGFRVNTFTHILEGYKVADKMKAHGVAASTFSDWWAYKMEVQDAMAYNAAIMQKVGLIVAINSDDAEMARHLNQEAAKSIKYGNLSEIQALNMNTINPATMLHVADRVGSIKVGKDADVVLWSASPVSIYAKPEKTIVDGVVYFDIEKDKQMQQQIAAERNCLIQKMINAKKGGAKTTAATVTFDVINECEIDMQHNHSIWQQQ
ncbi:amidohydrolase family protein [Panacibacter ginsenosidivorans]|uniref:Amidohydrolase family protein n=1 Tax=Panacibacter ginsenosidivorans TaxID=1813871 RepID=A0A5B8VBE5_9BACT|nr:amidohydrolase family protein [Panacibacter ginsenosidivorans]QEC67996.1 amidohydrolase family protein [Panacibacter ginsenosidivorans]